MYSIWLRRRVHSIPYPNIPFCEAKHKATRNALQSALTLIRLGPLTEPLNTPFFRLLNQQTHLSFYPWTSFSQNPNYIAMGKGWNQNDHFNSHADLTGCNSRCQPAQWEGEGILRHLMIQLLVRGLPFNWQTIFNSSWCIITCIWFFSLKTLSKTSSKSNRK